MYKEFPDGFFIEFGRALDVFYYNDNMKFGMRWMNAKPPIWTKDYIKKWNRF